MNSVEQPFTGIFGTLIFVLALVFVIYWLVFPIIVARYLKDMLQLQRKSGRTFARTATRFRRTRQTTGTRTTAMTADEPLELRDFVAETIKQVIDGVVTVQQYATRKKAVVDPRARDTVNLSSQSRPMYRSQQGEVIRHKAALPCSLACWDLDRKANQKKAMRQ